MLSKKLLESIPKSIRIIRKFSTESLSGALTLQQLRVLNLINDGYGQTQIAETFDVSMAAISKMISLLERKKLLVKKEGQDRRTQVLSLTPKGRLLLEKTAEYVSARLELGIKELSKTQKEELMKGLIVLDQLMQKLKEV